MIELTLTEAGFEVHTAGDGDRALAELHAWDPDVVVLDLNIPGPDGLEVCRRLRGFSSAYVLMLTARRDEVDKLVGLSSGANDYLTKPFSPKELVARIRAMLRRPRAIDGHDSQVPHRSRSVGPVTIDLDAREITVAGTVVNTTRIEFELLAAMSERPRLVHTRDQLRSRAWGESWLADDHAVDVHMSNLRRKLATAGAPGLLTTVRGVGYRINAGAT